MTNRFAKDLNRLVNGQQKSYQALAEIKTQPIVSVRSVGQSSKPPPTQNSNSSNENKNSIASPLTEIPGTREYYDTEILGSDGLFALEMKAIKSAQFKDANENIITINYAQE